MKSLIRFGLLVTILFTGSFVVNAQQAVTPEQKKSAAEVLATLSVWADAVRDRDAKSLDKLFAEELVITTYDGIVRGKKEELEILKPNANVKTVSIVNEDVVIKIFGDVAVVTALTKCSLLSTKKKRL